MQVLRQVLSVGRQQFSQPAIRSYYLWAEVLVLFVVAAEVVLLPAFLRLRVNSQMILWMSLPIAMLTVLWCGILRVHQVVHEACRNKWGAQENGSPEDPRINMLLDKLGFLSYAGFNYAATAVILAYGSLVPIAFHVRR
jgi:hypothetical protein